MQSQAVLPRNAYYLARFEAEKERFLEEWKTLLRIPSISNNPVYDVDCRRCADWLKTHLEQMGLMAEVVPTVGKPVVFAERAGDPGLPVLLYYGHYDVQPAEPLEEWLSPPFEPTLRDERVYARGALDNKGQTAFFLKAVETVIKAGALGCRLKVVLEGEEESGSAGLAACLVERAWKERLKSDVLLVCDSEGHTIEIPGVTMGLRGIIHLALTLKGPAFDLHSGIHGGAAPNPALGMARLLATLHDADGSIAVKGFCDSLTRPSDEIKRLLMAAPFDEECYIRDFGVSPAGGERRYPVQERLAFRPTIEINGIHSGYDGPGHKTIIPSSARAKITSRIAVGQDPQRSLQSIIDHLRANVPAGLTLEISDEDGSHGALAVDPASPFVKRAARVLQSIYGRDPLYLWCGASIPVVVSLIQAASAEPLLVGFGLPRDRMHGPNESFSMTQFRNGFLFSCLLLEELSKPSA
jgi:acetylornithine deacetylase/succinyl-diaminopimelate desuccinylase-like protein